MKQKDVALIIIIAFISGILSFVVSNKLFVTPANTQEEVETVDTISTDFGTPDKQYFNPTSINPTQTPQLSTNNNQNPFNGTGQ